MYSKSALKTHKGSGVNPVGADQPFIYREPPKAIFTRKKERVEMGDVQYMLRDDSPYGDPTRINEAIGVYGRGRNPMVKVDYGAGRGAKTAYKVEVVRPPLMPLETLQPISAPRSHQNHAIATNPGSAPISLSGFFDKTRVNQVNKVERNGGVIRSNPSVYTTTSQEVYDRNNFKDSSSITNTNPYAIMSKVAVMGGSNVQGDVDKSKIKDTLLKTLGTNFSSIVLYDPKTNTAINVYANLKEKNYMAVNAAYSMPIIVNTPDGKEIKLKDYTYQLVQPNIGNSQLIIQVEQPDVVLDRNTPLYSLSTNVKSNIGYNDDIQRTNEGKISLDKLTNFGEYSDRVSRPVYDAYAQMPVGGSFKKSTKIM
jgi:hypothetical protein